MRTTRVAGFGGRASVMLLFSVGLLVVEAFGKKKKAPEPPPEPLVPPEIVMAGTATILGLLIVAALFLRKEKPPHEVCSLVFLDSNGGCLSACWHMSDEPIDGALATFSPSIAVPSHRMTHNAGRTELCRGVGGPSPAGFYAGWCQYIGLAHKFVASLKFVKNIANRPVAVHAVNADTTLSHIKEGESLPMSPNLVAVAVTAALEQDFDLKAMPVLKFKQLGNKLGATVVFDKAADSSEDKLGDVKKLMPVLSRQSTHCDEFTTTSDKKLELQQEDKA